MGFLILLKKKRENVFNAIKEKAIKIGELKTPALCRMCPHCLTSILVCNLLYLKDYRMGSQWQHLS